MKIILLLAACALPSPPARQDLLQVGVAPADTESFQVDSAVTVSSKGKAGAALDYHCAMQVAFTSRKTDAGATLQGRFLQFSFAGTAGEAALDIKWAQGQKVEDAAWGAAAGLRRLVTEGFSVDVDKAGNPVSCASAEARLLVMAFDPLLAGSATWFDGGTRAIGERWTSSFQNAEADVACANLYDKNENGAAVVTTAFTIKDRRAVEAPTGGGTGRSEVDLATGRPRGCTLSIDLPSKDHPVHLEATTKVVPGKRP